MVNVTYDVTVIGGGMAGVCAAIAAARHGAKTALIQNRPVLGGNSSSEIRIWTCGATAMGRNRYAAETGIIGEMDLENLYRNPEGNPYIWDSILLDFVMREKNLTLYLNTVALKTIGSDSHLEKIQAYQLTTETWFDMESAFFVDCTGDGSIGAMAGVPYMHGREAAEQFHESLAPQCADSFTLGNTLLLYSRNAGKPVHYQAPEFAYDISYIEKLVVGNEKPLSLESSGCDFWWLETGGSMDTIHDGETIRLELQRLVYGIWNYIKNSGRFEADNLELEWIGNLPGKRESRRLIGPYILTQNDILEHHNFTDAVCCGGWPIDTHPPGGIYSKKEACEQRDAGIYQIPLRCLYAKQVKNLFFAGRNISASHLAFASVRVMKTCAAMGQAVGTAAALCKKWNKCPAELSEEEVQNLQRTLIWDDQWIPNESVQEKSRDCLPEHVSASGFQTFNNTSICRMQKLDRELWVQMPKLPRKSNVSFWMTADILGEYRMEILTGNQRHACNDMRSLGEITVYLDRQAKWVPISINEELSAEQDLFIRIPAFEGTIGVSKYSVCGCIGAIGSRTSLQLVNPCFIMENDPGYFQPEQAATLPTRATNIPNQWVSRPLDEEPAWLKCELPDVLRGKCKEMQILFDTDLNRDYNQLKPDYYGNGWNSMPAPLLKDFRIYTDDGTENWNCWKEFRNFHQRSCYIALEKNVQQICIEVLSTWGDPCAHIYGIRFREQK